MVVGYKLLHLVKCPSLNAQTALVLSNPYFRKLQTVLYKYFM